MTQVDAGGILDIAMAGTSATLLARKWESALLVNVDNDTLKKIMSSKEAMDAMMKIEGFRALGSDVFETVVNKSENVKATKKAKGDDVDPKTKKELTAEEKEYKSKRKQIQEKLIKFATRIPAFMYLTDFRENKLRDVITKIEPELFKTVTGLTVEDFNLLVSLNVFNSGHMNQAVFISGATRTLPCRTPASRATKGSATTVSTTRSSPRSTDGEPPEGCLIRPPESAPLACANRRFVRTPI